LLLKYGLRKTGSARGASRRAGSIWRSTQRITISSLPDDEVLLHIENDQPELDPEGTELADADRARSAALVLLGEMIRDTYRYSRWNGDPWKVWVSDGPGGSGRVLFTVHLSAM
jgi:Domain of unknown function (DUF6894)